MSTEATRILLIEDDADSRNNTRMLLELEGFRVEVAADGIRGLAALSANPPDLVVCDILMPRMDGMAVIRQIRETPAHAGIPFIFLTGLADYASLRAGMNHGADDYLTKPFSPQQLIDAIHTRLRRLRTTAPRPTARQEGLEQLSGREQEIFNLIGEGLTSREIAVQLSISPRTVDSHRASILEKLSLESGAALIRLAALHRARG